MADRGVRVVSEDGELLPNLSIDPSGDYQPMMPPMSRDITLVAGVGFEPTTFGL